LFLISSFNLFGQIPMFKWVKKIPFEIVCQCADNEDNIYIAGNFSDTILFENQLIFANDNVSNVLVAKFDSTGNLLWYRQFGGAEGDWSADIELDHNNDLIITNYFHGSTIYYGDTIDPGMDVHGAIITKLSNNGELIWYKVPGYNDNGCFHVFFSTVDQENNILISGDIQHGNGIFTDTIIPSLGLIPGFAAKYNTHGDFLWVRKFDDLVYQFSFDFSNNILLFSDSIHKYTAADEHIWTKGTNVDFPLSDFWPQMATDSLDNFYLAANIGSTFIAGDDSLVSGGNSRFLYVKCNPSGDPVMGVSIICPYYSVANSIFIKKNRLLIAGTFRDKIFFDSDSLISMAKYRNNIFIAEYDLSGNRKFIKKIDSRYGCSSHLISMSKSIYLSGYSYDSTYFDNILLINGNNSFSHGYFLSRLQSEVVHPIIYPETFEIYPNPTRNSFTVNFNPYYKNVTLTIFDLQGKRIMDKDLSNYSNSINIGFLSKGLYIVKLKTDDDIIFRKIEKL
ncbi:MAG TPA: T9SS type A sorting domain-containing protein, partial [Bacteroidales bacterium]|nr:T9SS type A sorting domain-containing protein [Bacteroidales bacterium]